LVDTGTSSSLINKDIVENSSFEKTLSKKSTLWVTQAGTFETEGQVKVENFFLPQFTNKRKITSDFHMFEMSSKDTYDLILGRDILTEIGFNMLYENSKFMWQDIQVDMVPRGHWSKENISTFWRNFKTEQEEEANLAIIKPAEYKEVDITSVAEAQQHLTLSERNKLRSVLTKFQRLFKGQCGSYNGPPIQLELLPNLKPFYRKPFQIPQAYQEVTKAEINRLESLGLLTKVSSSEWAAPTFVIPKKNQTVRVITDFRGFNKCLKRKPYPIPRIPDIFHGLKKFHYATTIDLNMGYYSMALDDEAKALCVISLPWGLYQYNVLPQGVKVASDIFQERMGALFLDMDAVICYMDDIIIIGHKDFIAHLLDVEDVLKRLQEAGFQVNPGKCIWFAASVDYLGFTITRNGIKPQDSKIQGILNIATPKTQKDIRKFVGMVNFYRDLFPKRAAILAPLTDLCGKNKTFVWNPEQNEAFLKVKQLMGQETLLTYPLFDKPFIIYTDASEKQMGGIVTQEGKPLGYFSKKLNETQQRYPVTEQELLAIVEI
jgi:hypothetical protein